ncbi:ComF family protein [Agathobaculum sp.]|uniref:ComF family protein n=1 Tax=Agathobaculum sp. TaxID=2048138 RepID=UPI002A80BB39|nr:ComF family protein [Agathobaculum sp.]MDY3618844.1 ComF family protein [Agathobaculum sp.]
MGLIYPKKCLLCREPLAVSGTGNAMLCEACARRVRQEYRCIEGIRVSGIDGVAAPLYYKGLVAEAMKRYKFSHFQHYAPWFAAQLAPLIAEHLEDWQPDLITFIPIGMFRLYQRGYNQSKLLAEPIAAQFDLPCIPLLRKRPFSAKQSLQKNAAKRFQNVKKSFLPMNTCDLSGKSVLIIDDIITTGATVSAAASILRQMGASRVFAAAATRTPHK